MRRPHIAITLCILPFTSALSLANFQQISPGAVSIFCLVAYDSQIPSCTEADFADGAACSQSCIAGLDLINTAVNSACQGIQVSSATLLGMVFNGKMLGALCPNTITTTTAATPSQTTSIAPKKATTVATSTARTTSSESSETVSSTTSTTVKTTSSSTPIIIKTTSTATTESANTVKKTSATSTSTSNSDTSTIAVDTSTTPTAASTTTSSSSTASKAAQTHQNHQSEQQIQIDAMKDTGGGSPFDIVDTSGTQISRGNHCLILIGLGITTGILLVV